MEIKESAENYLETIFMLHKKNGYVRSIDIANELSYAKASVSVAMKSLRENGYLVVDEDGGLILTDKGNEIAQKMYERHQVIAQALMSLGVDDENAYRDSCKIEHYISKVSFDKIKEYVNKLKG